MLLLLLSLICVYTNEVSASEFISPFDLKGKTVIISPYDDGCTVFPFVYTKESFYTGKTSKKHRVEEQFLGVPINIIDVQILNKGKSSEKYCILFSKDGKDFSVVIPLCVAEITDKMQIFQKICFCNIPRWDHYNDPFTFEEDEEKKNIQFLCYDYKKLKSIEENHTNKTVTKSFKGIKAGSTFIRFIFKRGTGGRLLWIKGQNYNKAEWMNYLYAEFSDNIKTELFEISPLRGINKYRQNGYNDPSMYSLEDIENLF